MMALLSNALVGDQSLESQPLDMNGGTPDQGRSAVLPPQIIFGLLRPSCEREPCLLIAR
jgi:hypothetical protein